MVIIAIVPRPYIIISTIIVDVRRSPSSYQKLDGCNREEHIELDDDATNAAIDDDDDDDGGGVRRSGDARGYGIAFSSPETVRHQFSARKRLVLIRIKVFDVHH